MRYGRSAPRGFLPVYSVDTAEEAEALLRFACPTNPRGDYVAPELAESQTLENLALFAHRLAVAHAKLRSTKTK